MAVVLTGLSGRVTVARGIRSNESNLSQDQPVVAPTLSENGYTIIFGGDVMLARDVGYGIKYNSLDPFQDVRGVLSAADLAVANLECVVSDRGIQANKKYTFRADPAVLPLLKSSGIDMVSVANNHAGDFGREAFVDMLSRLREEGIGYFGGGANIAEAYTLQMALVGDLRVALLAVSNIETPYFAASDNQAGIAWVDDDRIANAIKSMRDSADIIVVVPHWGWEYTEIVSEEQERLAHLMIDAGADAVIGSHPHHIQRDEEYNGKLIVYSMGNFIFEGVGPNAGWSLGELIRIRIGVDKKVAGYDKIPYKISVAGVASLL